MNTIRGALAGAVLTLCLSGFDASAATNPYGVAVIIGNKNYANERVPEVSFAHRDADAFRRYVLDVLGFKPENIVDLRDATQAQMETAFGNERSHEGQLWSYLDPKGRSDIVVYYSGHGVPGLKDRRGYLLPANANPDTAEINGYPIDLLYGNLGKLEEARSVQVFLDACFSGDSHQGMLVRSASPVFVQAEVPKAAGNLTVLTAASDEQVASWDEAAEHGLFTTHLLDALYGGADANGDSQVTAAEVKDYLDETMTVAARRTYLRRQTASLNGSGETVLAATTGGVSRVSAPSASQPARRAAAPAHEQAAEAALGLTRTDRIAIQRGLNALDLSAGPADGMLGPNSRDAIKAWQEAKGLAATGYLDAMQAEALIATGQDVAAVAKPPEPTPAPTPAQMADEAIMGSWSIDWQGAIRRYSGTMEVDQRLGDNRYHGVVTVRWGDGESVTQEATLEVSGNEVKINCYNPDRGWTPDNFFVTLLGDRMEGHSVDDAGQRGSSITFTR